MDILNFILLQATQNELFLWKDVLESLLYSVVGLGLAVFAYKIIDWITPGNLSKQIAVEGNVALAILVGSLMIGICIIIASALN
jgi:uncharacterized membrane protein YjfL (UPF0719 family)